jgi:hypothetical protein
MGLKGWLTRRKLRVRLRCACAFLTPMPGREGRKSQPDMTHICSSSSSSKLQLSTAWHTPKWGAVEWRILTLSPHHYCSNTCLQAHGTWTQQKHKL